MQTLFRFTRPQRRLVATVWLAGAILAAGYLASVGDAQQDGVRDGALPPFLELLAELEVAHVVIHLIVFGIVGVLLTDSPRLAWQHILLGAVAMEVLQVIVGNHESVMAVVWCVSFDLLMDVGGGWLGLKLTRAPEEVKTG